MLADRPTEVPECDVFVLDHKVSGDQRDPANFMVYNSSKWLRKIKVRCLLTLPRGASGPGRGRIRALAAVPALLPHLLLHLHLLLLFPTPASNSSSLEQPLQSALNRLPLRRLFTAAGI